MGAPLQGAGFGELVACTLAVTDGAVGAVDFELQAAVPAQAARKHEAKLVWPLRRRESSRA